MVAWLIGIAGMLLGTVEQFLVNESRIVAGVILIAGCALLLGMRKKKQELPMWQLWLIRVVTALHFAGVFSDRWLVYTGLGVLTVLVGAIVTVWAWKNMRPQHKGQITIQLTASVISSTFAIVILFTAFFSAISMGIIKNMAFPVENIRDADQSETILDNGIRLVSNVRYDAEYPNGFLDIYYSAPHSGETPPTLLVIHGGGYIWGDKSSGDPNAGELDMEDTFLMKAVNAGYNVVSLNYCLAPEYIYPDSIIQLNNGLAYLKNHADELGLNMEQVFLDGGSAGGNLAGVLANLQTSSDYAQKMQITPGLNATDIRGVLFESALFDNSQYGVTHDVGIDYLFYQLGRVYLRLNDLQHDTSGKIANSNVIDNVTAQFPPCVISDGNSGTFYEQAFAMNAKLVELGVECKFIYYPKTVARLGHGYESLGSDYAKITQDRMIEFMNAHAD